MITVGTLSKHKFAESTALAVISQKNMFYSFLKLEKV